MADALVIPFPARRKSAAIDRLEAALGRLRAAIGEQQGAMSAWAASLVELNDQAGALCQSHALYRDSLAAIDEGLGRLRSQAAALALEPIAPG